MLSMSSLKSFSLLIWKHFEHSSHQLVSAISQLNARNLSASLSFHAWLLLDTCVRFPYRSTHSLWFPVNLHHRLLICFLFRLSKHQSIHTVKSSLPRQKRSSVSVPYLCVFRDLFSYFLAQLFIFYLLESEF